MKITVYSTPHCPYCIMVKDFLKEKNIVFYDLNVAENQEAADMMVLKSGQLGVPVIVVEKDGGGEEIIIGFDRDKLLSILDINN
ncbi:MAG: hypothetical protein A2604_01585 [Candidatus Liptonbacteria bacterium RIFOXYD1_FULL_36_11]|uniref:Glutaredoxin domain-containing protein n=1 Tax=Candidatus Liptonbacteria bacterium RIFOXYD1_FULL_36_11 TaxID=1798656 RepID=A0A1G2CT66_9BACT|nr:MAG: hypothetical protein A2604_01585 [Candidatus Liptonbacteria bacterium RIFOXYD1_FULL_36_11]